MINKKKRLSEIVCKLIFNSIFLTYANVNSLYEDYLNTKTCNSRRFKENV